MLFDSTDGQMLSDLDRLFNQDIENILLGIFLLLKVCGYKKSKTVFLWQNLPLQSPWLLLLRSVDTHL